MVEVVKMNKVPTAEIECQNCKSILRYGNRDLDKYYPEDNLQCSYLYKKPYYAFRCPVCGIRVTANWIENNDKELDDKLNEGNPDNS